MQLKQKYEGLQKENEILLQKKDRIMQVNNDQQQKHNKLLDEEAQSTKNNSVACEECWTITLNCYQ